MTEVVCRLATPEDADEIFNMKICDADLRELAASTHKTPELVLVESIEMTPELWVVTKAGRIVAVFGVAPTPMNDIGVPWFLSSGEMTTFCKTFLKESREIIKRFQQEYVKLCVVVDSRYEESNHWLKWLGFEQLPDSMTFHDPSVPFYCYVRTAANV